MPPTPTIKDWLQHATDQLTNAQISSAAIDSRLILEQTLNKDRTFLLRHPERTLSPEELKQATQLLARRTHYEPMAYILGRKEFFGVDFKTDQRALIPRGESECLVEVALEWLKDKTEPCCIAEVGTGSGALILTLAKQIPNHHYYATEVSQDAMALARENANQLNLSNVTFMVGDLGAPLLDSGLQKQIDLLIANLPYIRTDLLINLEPTVHYFEPHIALEGGTNGLALYERFFPQAAQLLKSNGLLLCEHDHDQGEALRKLAKQHFPKAQIETRKDFSGLDRLLFCRNG